MYQIHTMIVDDEAPARQQLATMLVTDHRIRIVAQCSGCRDGLVAIERLRDAVERAATHVNGSQDAGYPQRLQLALAALQSPPER